MMICLANLQTHAPNLMQPRRKERVGDIESVQPAIVQPIVDNAAQVQPFSTHIPRQSSENCHQQILAFDLRITAPMKIYFSMRKIHNKN